MKLSLFRDSYINVKSTETIDTWEEFVDLVIQPLPGQKNGDYFVRGFCEGDRKDENMKSFDLIIIDGDQTLDNGASCVPLLQAHKAIQDKNITHVMYTSYSNNVINGINKWRLCVPCNDLVDTDTANQGAAEIITILHKAGLMVRFVKEMRAASQPWFLPRYSPNESPEDNFDYRFFDGETYSLTGDIIDSAHFVADAEGNLSDKGGIFNWDTICQQFQENTLHQGIGSACGWLILTTDWADSQIKQYLLAIIKRLCTDETKIKRAVETKEIDKFIKHCRDKAGTNVEAVENWKNHLYTAQELHEKDFPPIKWAVDHMIPEGLTVLAGDPKAGKSMLAVDLCSSIAGGEKVLGVQPCKKGVVMYMSFEDPFRRVKERIKDQCDSWPDTFKMVDRGIPALGLGFYKVVDEMLLMWPELRAIVIDTLQFLVPPKKPGVADYDHYYSFLNPLHKWAIDCHVAVILITHKNKARIQAGDNPFNNIIGSQGISANADCLMMLSRNYAKETDASNINLPDGFLDCSGREIEAARFNLEWDTERIQWSMIEAATGEHKNGKTTSKMQILETLRAAKAPMFAKTLSAAANVNYSTTKTILQRGLKKGEFTKGEQGYSPFGHIYQDSEW